MVEYKYLIPYLMKLGLLLNIPINSVNRMIWKGILCLYSAERNEICTIINIDARI